MPHLSLFSKILLHLLLHMGFRPTQAHFSAFPIDCEFVEVNNFLELDLIFAELNDLRSGVYDEAGKELVVEVLGVFEELSLETSDDADQRVVLVL